MIGNIGIDTNILIWGLDRKCSPGMEPQLKLAARFFEYVAQEKIPVVIPSQALAEFLVRNTEQERAEALAKIEENFPIAPLDTPASVLAAEISSDRNHCDEVRKKFGVTRVCYKADINIIASALQFGVTRLVTGNGPEIKGFAKGRLIVDTLEEFVLRYIDKPEEPTKPKDEQLTLLFAAETDSPIDHNGKPRFYGVPPQAIDRGGWRVRCPRPMYSMRGSLR